MIATVADLIERYRGDEGSPYHAIRHRTRMTYDANMRRIDGDHGRVRLSVITREDIRKWYAAWLPRGVTMAHGLKVMLGILFNYGSLLENRDCDRLSGMMRKEKFKQGAPDDRILTPEHAMAIRAEAHRQGCPSIALQQSFYDTAMRQTDSVGEWVPLDEPGVSDIVSRRFGKWLRGARWEEIDRDLIFTHVTSKRNKRHVIDLKDASMMIEEFNIIAPGCVVETNTGIIVRRELLPAKGPMIVNEKTGLPYVGDTFRKRWRVIARAAGVPDNIKSRHTRPGRLTQVIGAGASIEDAQKLAQHSTTAMTSRYWRGGHEAVSRAMKATKRTRRADVA